MKLPKSLTTITPLSKTLSVTLFVLLPFVGFWFGMKYGAMVETLNVVEKMKISETSQMLSKKTEAPIKLGTKPGWFRYINTFYDYSIDYPENYYLYPDTPTQITFSKKTSQPSGVGDYVFVYKGESTQYSEDEIKTLENMSVGQTGVIKRKETSLPDDFFTYKRLADEKINGKVVKSYISNKLFEFPDNTILHLYIYKNSSGETYTFGGITNDVGHEENNISEQESRKIISTLIFLD